MTIDRIDESIIAICEEYDAIRHAKPSEEEVQRAKNYLKGKVTLRMEDSEEVASFLGTQALLKNEIQTIDEYFDAIDAVTVNDVFAVAQMLFDPAKRSMSIIGLYAGQEERLEKVLKDA